MRGFLVRRYPRFPVGHRIFAGQRRHRADVEKTAAEISTRQRQNNETALPRKVCEGRIAVALLLLSDALSPDHELRPAAY
jgi:hypothetical protein